MKVDLQVLLPSERAALAASFREAQAASEEWKTFEPIIRARAGCSDDEVIVLDFPTDTTTTARAITREAFRQMTERDAPAAEGRGVPVLSTGARKDTLIGFAHPTPAAAARLVRAERELSAVMTTIGNEQLAYRLDEADRRRAPRATSSRTPAAATSPTAQARKRWEDLTVAEMQELRRRSPHVFDRLLEDYRTRKASGAAR